VVREFLERLLAFFRKSGQEQDLDAEMKAHLAFAIDENVAAGMTSAEARRRALIRFGGVEAAKELHRETRSFVFLENLAQDLRYALRMMRRDPGFSVFAILIIALGIGASTTVFSVLRTVLIRPLPFRDPANLVWLANSQPEEGLWAQTFQVFPFLALKARNHFFSDMAAYYAFYGVGDSQLTVNGESERLNALPVSQNFFPMLGIRPQLGRNFSAEECKWNGAKAVLVSHGLWERRFASDSHLVGRTVTLDNEPVTIVGALPKTFDFGSVFAPGTHMDVYLPFPLTQETDRQGNTLSVIGRLKPGVSVGRAQAEASVLGVHISAEQPNRNSVQPRLSLLKDHVSGKLRPALIVLGFAVAAVMLIVCANLSNLLLARSTARLKELAIRSALGAGRRRLVAQILTESLLLSLSGALLGTGLALVGTSFLARLTSFNIPLLAEVRVDTSALLFTLLLALLTGVLFGVLPALQVPRVKVSDAMKEQSRSSTGSRHHAWVRGALVVSEIAFAAVLIVGTGLLLHSFLRVLDVNLGFQPVRAAAMRIDPSAYLSTQEKANSYLNEALRRVREIPGVEAAGINDSLPLGSNRTWNAAAKGVVYPRDNYPEAFVHIASDGYLAAMGILLKDGHDFSQRDDANAESVILINETLAHNLWPGQNPLGRLMVDGDKKDKRVIGVVRNVHHLGLEQASGAEMYFPMRQTRDYGSMQLVVRSRLNLPELNSAVRAALLQLDRGLPREEFRPLQEIVDHAASPRRFIVLLLSGFASFALLLASLGIYAVISYSVGQRTQEIGIRMALGASPGVLQRSILWQTLVLAGIGLLLGTAASAWLTLGLKSLLFGVPPRDPVTFLGMLAVLIAVAGLAGFLPAQRAARVNPVAALRAN
jgi:predicted permease